LVRKIFKFYINDMLLFKCPIPGPKVKSEYLVGFRFVKTVTGQERRAE